MDKEEAKEIVLQAWEKWKLDPEVRQTESSEKQTVGQWLFKKLNIKVPETPETLRYAFVCRFYAENRGKLKGVSIRDIVNWIKQKEVEDTHLEANIKMLNEVLTIIFPHLDTLYKKRQRMLLKDDYGFADDTKWQKELDYFVNQAIIPNLRETMESAAIALLHASYYPNMQEVIDGTKVFPIVENYVKQYINDVLDDHVADPLDSERDIMLLDPTEYEHFCANILKEIGWDVRVTQATGDQGIDILAEREGFLLAIQCKKYSSPVGNKAVQEVYSGGKFYNANAFAVVSPVEYTPSARELANSLGVHLFHHDDLATLTITDKEKEC